jgi:hypothetical protein
MAMKKLVCLTSIVLLAVILTGCATPTQTPIPAESLIKPGDKIGEMTIQSAPPFHYYSLQTPCDFDWTITEPIVQTVDCTIPELSAIGVPHGWVAEESRIESNWQAMSWELSIDDYPIALDDFGWDDVRASDAGVNIVIRLWNVTIENLSAGKHTIYESVSLDTTVDDGYPWKSDTTYSPGKYEYIINLTVTEKPVYPAISKVAETGQHAYTSQNTKLDFLLYLPETYGKDPETRWPLLVYLHDAELRGTIPDFLRGDSLPKELETRKDLPFIVFSPVGNGGWDFWSKDEMITPLFSVLEEIQSLYSVDEERIYLTGAGMGGNGVWIIGLRHPEYFAALAPLGGYVYPFEVPENICDLKHVPVWAFHGGKDFMVPAAEEQKLVDALNACGGNAQLTVEPHAVMPLEEYSNPELYEWFLSQSKE